MHHNVFELGTDRFNEAVIIKDQIIAFLESSRSMDDPTFHALPEFVQTELREGVLERIEEIGIENFIKVIEERFLSPKIGMRLPLTLA